MDDDDFDIYGDLEEFEYKTKYKEAETKIEDLQSKLGAALQRINTLETENAELQTRNDNLQRSFQSLLLTARAEVKRKDAQIFAARNERDDVLFRRKNIGQNRRHEDYRTQHKEDNFNENSNQLKSNIDSENLKPINHQDSRNQNRNPFYDSRNQSRIPDRDPRFQSKILVQDHANQSKQSVRNNNEERPPNSSKINSANRSESIQLDPTKNIVIPKNGSSDSIKEQKRGDTVRVADHDTVLRRNDSSEKELYTSREHKEKGRNESKQICKASSEQSHHLHISHQTNSNERGKRIPLETNSIEEEKLKKPKIGPSRSECPIEQPCVRSTEIKVSKSDQCQDSKEQENCSNYRSSLISKVDDNNIKTYTTKPTESVNKALNELINFNEHADILLDGEEIRLNRETNEDYDDVFSTLEAPINKYYSENQRKFDKNQTDEYNTKQDKKDNLKGSEQFERIDKRNEESRRYRSEHRSKERDEEDHRSRQERKTDHKYNKKSERNDDGKTSNKRDEKRKKSQCDYEETRRRDHKDDRDDRYRSRKHRDSGDEKEKRDKRKRRYERSSRDREKEKQSRYEKYDRGRDRKRDRKRESKSRSKSKSSHSQSSHKTYRSHHDTAERKSRDNDHFACSERKERHSSREKRSKEKEQSSRSKKSENHRKDDIEQHEKQTISEVIGRNTDPQENDEVKAEKRAREEETFERNSKRVKPNNIENYSREFGVHISNTEYLEKFDVIDRLSNGSKRNKPTESLEKESGEISIQPLDTQTVENFERIATSSKDSNRIKVTKRVDNDAMKIMTEQPKMGQVDNFTSFDLPNKDASIPKLTKKIEIYSKETEIQKAESETIKHFDSWDKNSKGIALNESKVQKQGIQKPDPENVDTSTKVSKGGQLAERLEKSSTEIDIQKPESENVEVFESIHTFNKDSNRVKDIEKVAHENVAEKSKTKIIGSLGTLNKESKQKISKESQDNGTKQANMQKQVIDEFERYKKIKTPSNDLKSPETTEKGEQHANNIFKHKPQTEKDAMKIVTQKPGTEKETEIVTEKSETKIIENFDTLKTYSKNVELNESIEKELEKAGIQKPELKKVVNFERSEMSRKDSNRDKESENDNEKTGIEKSKSLAIDSINVTLIDSKHKVTKKTSIEELGSENIENFTSNETSSKDLKSVILAKTGNENAKEVESQKPERNNDSKKIIIQKPGKEKAEKSHTTDPMKPTKVQITDKTKKDDKEVVNEKQAAVIQSLEKGTVEIDIQGLKSRKAINCERTHKSNADSKSIKHTGSVDQNAKEIDIPKPETKEQNYFKLSKDSKRLNALERVETNPTKIIVQKLETETGTTDSFDTLNEASVELILNESEDKVAVKTINQKVGTDKNENFESIDTDMTKIKHSKKAKQHAKDIVVYEQESENDTKNNVLETPEAEERSDAKLSKDSKTVDLTGGVQQHLEETMTQKPTTETNENLDEFNKNIKKIKLGKSDKTKIPSIQTPGTENAEKSEGIETSSNNLKTFNLSEKIQNNVKDIVIEKPESAKGAKKIDIQKPEIETLKNLDILNKESKRVPSLAGVEKVSAIPKSDAKELVSIETLAKDSENNDTASSLNKYTKESTLKKEETGQQKALSKKSNKAAENTKTEKINKIDTSNMVIKKKPARSKKAENLQAKKIEKRKVGGPKKVMDIVDEKSKLKKGENTDCDDMISEDTAKVNESCENNAKEPEKPVSFDMSQEDYVAAMRLQLELEMYNAYSNEVNYYEDPSISMRPTYVYQVMGDSQILSSNELEQRDTTMKKDCEADVSENRQCSNQSQDDLTCDQSEKMIDSKNNTCNSNDTSIDNASKEVSAFNISAELNQMEIETPEVKHQESATKESEASDLNQLASDDEISPTPDNIQETKHGTSKIQQNLNSVTSIAINSKIEGISSKSDDKTNTIENNLPVKTSSPNQIDIIENKKLNSSIPSDITDNEQQRGGNINMVNEDTKLQSIGDHADDSHYETNKQTATMTSTTTKTSLQTAEMLNHQPNSNVSINSPSGNRFESSEIISGFQNDEEIFETPIKAPLQDEAYSSTPSVQLEIKLMTLKRLVRKRTPSVHRKLKFATKKKYEEEQAKRNSNILVSNNCCKPEFKETEQISANNAIPSKMDEEIDEFEELAREVFGDIWDSANNESIENNEESFNLSTNPVCADHDSTEAIRGNLSEFLQIENAYDQSLVKKSKKAKPVGKKKVNSKAQNKKLAKGGNDVHESGCNKNDEQLIYTCVTESETAKMLKSAGISKHSTEELYNIKSIKTSKETEIGKLSYSTDAIVTVEKITTPKIPKQPREEIHDVELIKIRKENVGIDKISKSTNAIVEAKSLKLPKILKPPIEELHDVELLKISDKNVQNDNISNSTDIIGGAQKLKSSQTSKQPTEELYDVELIKISDKINEVDESSDSKDSNVAAKKLESTEISKQPIEELRDVELLQTCNENMELDSVSNSTATIVAEQKSKSSEVLAQPNKMLHVELIKKSDKIIDIDKLPDSSEASVAVKKLESVTISKQPFDELNNVESTKKSNENVEIDNSDSTDALVAAISSTRSELTITLVNAIEPRPTTPTKSDQDSQAVYIDLTTPPSAMDRKRTYGENSPTILDTNLPPDIEHDLQGSTPTIKSLPCDANNQIILNECNQTDKQTVPTEQIEDNIDKLSSNKPEKDAELVENQVITINRKRKKKRKLAKKANKKQSKASRVENNNEKVDNISTLDIKIHPTNSSPDSDLQIKENINKQVKSNQLNRTDKLNSKSIDVSISSGVKCIGKQPSKKSHGVKLIGHIIDGFEREPSPTSSNHDSSRVLKNELFMDATRLSNSSPLKSDNFEKHRLSDTSSSDTSAEIRSITCNTNMVTVKRRKQDVNHPQSILGLQPTADSLEGNIQIDSCAEIAGNVQMENELFGDILDISNSTPIKMNNFGKHRLSNTSSSDTSAEIISTKHNTKKGIEKHDVNPALSNLAIRSIANSLEADNQVDNCPALTVDSHIDNRAAFTGDYQIIDDMKSTESSDSKEEALDKQILNQGCALNDAKILSGTNFADYMNTKVREMYRLGVGETNSIKASDVVMTIIPRAKKKPKQLTQSKQKVAPKVINDKPKLLRPPKSALINERPSSPVKDHFSNPISNPNSSESICDSSTPVTSTNTTPIKPHDEKIVPKTSSLTTTPVLEGNANISGEKTVPQSLDSHQNDPAGTQHEKRNISLASTNYLIEQVNNNVVNVFITRKKVKKKKKD